MTAADLARTEGVADSGYRLTTNVGGDAGQSVAPSPPAPARGPLDVVAARVTRRRRPVRTTGLPALAVAIALVLAGCAGMDANLPQGPAATPIGSPALGPSAEAIRQAVFGALGRQNLIVAPTSTPFRPPESAPLAAAPRNVYQVALPQAPDEGFIVVYELPTEADAIAAAGAQRDYIAQRPRPRAGAARHRPRDPAARADGHRVRLGAGRDRGRGRAARRRGAAHDRHDVRRRPVGENPEQQWVGVAMAVFADGKIEAYVGPLVGAADDLEL